MSTPEKDFINKFVALATLQHSGLPSDTKKPLQDVTNLGVALPALRYKYNHKRVKRSELVESDAASTVQLRLKSIRAPKFVHTKEFSVSQTIHQVKRFLTEVEEAIEDPSQLKLLLKGKVLHDNVLLSDLKAQEADLVVMVSKFEKPVIAAQPDIAPAAFEIPWHKIKALLSAEISDAEAAATVFQRLQKGWQLTEPSDLD
ncbi:LAME_0F19372g1_1 [Lachancea meyersii CBS 8951]|uniref:LAME_0F19372g1_1 n=1 Tax=Lachancea meyersii CBS 8951 TaxID=1266667 RepID=A0A1G4K1J9_9SACH|nr:LAME_0F19372g1_1 [Lachancea meyersii CBS 8951]